MRTTSAVLSCAITALVLLASIGRVRGEGPYAYRALPVPLAYVHTAPAHDRHDPVNVPIQRRANALRDGIDEPVGDSAPSEVREPVDRSARYGGRAVSVLLEWFNVSPKDRETILGVIIAAFGVLVFAVAERISGRS